MNCINLIIEWTADLRVTNRASVCGDVVLDIEVKHDGHQVIEWNVGRVGGWRAYKMREFEPAPDGPLVEAIKAEAKLDVWLDVEVRDLTAEELGWSDADPNDEHRLSAAQLGVGIGRAA